MSLFGKILALLNLFGAVGLVFVAMLDYGKRQSLAYSYFRHELTLRGLPLNDKETDVENQPIVDRMGETLPGEMFNAVGGNPVVTQTAEVERLKGLLDAKIATAQNKPQQTYFLARILLSLADDYLEREQLLACRVHLATDASTAALKKRCEEAFRNALAAGVPDAPEQSFHDAFRLAFRANGGPPAAYFVSLLVANLPDQRAKAASAKIDVAFDAAIEAQRVALEKRYNTVFADALGTTPQASSSPSSQQAQRAAVARLMFGIAPYLAEEAILADPANAKMPAGPVDSAPYQQALIETEPFRVQVRRTYVVCGLTRSVEAISDRAGVLRRLANYVEQSSSTERIQFLFDHAAILTQLREYASVVRDEQLHIADNKKKLSDYEEVVRQRIKEVADLKIELEKSREDTKEEVAKLRDLSEKVLQLRIRVRDAIRDNERGEKRIRELEKQVRDLEK